MTRPPGEYGPGPNEGQQGPPPGYGQGPGYGPPPGYGQGPGYGYGQYPGYARPQAPKPGLIPLRPLSVGEILDGAFSAMRSNPKATLGLSAIVAAISGVVGTVPALILIRVGRTGAYWPAFLSPVVSFLASEILTGMLTVVIGQGVLGRKERIGDVWRATRSRILPLIGTSLLTLGLAVGWAAAIALSVAIGFGLGDGAHLPAVGVLVAIVGVLAATVFAAIIGIRWSLAAPAVVLERMGPAASLGRSWRLVRGSSWRVLGILLLTSLIVGAASTILEAPFLLASLGSFLGGGLSTLATNAHGATVLATVLSAIGAIVAGAVTRPVRAGVTVLLYTDLRMRREGLDITLQTAAGQPASQVQPGVSQW